MVVVVMMAMEHRAIVMTPAPATEAAVRAIVAAERAIIPEERAGEQTSDKGQYKNEDDETEHCYSPFASLHCVVRASLI